MVHLTLTGVSDDGKRLLLVTDAGDEFTLDIDARLRAALRGDGGSRRLETKMDSALRPRDIQARIRAGETPEAVAEAAHTTVDKIMAFAAPVLAERQHVADRAQRSSVRRRSGGDQATTGARTLGDAVTGHLRAQNIDPEIVEWDAWRREDGRWSLTGEFSSSKRSGYAQFTFDMPGNYVTADNEDARWLLGEIIAPPRTAPRNDLEQARQRRLNAVQPAAERSPDDELPLGDDAIEMVSGDLGVEQPLEAFLTEEPPPAEETQLREEAADAAARDASRSPESPAAPEEPAAEHEPAREEPPARRPVRKSRGRASVPSWDEIMFGGGKSE